MSVILVYSSAGKPIELKEPKEIEEWLKAPSTSYWLDLISPTKEEIEWLAETFGFHPLAIEDLQEQNPRPKMDDYPKYIFMVAHSALIDGKGLDLIEVHVFMAEHYVVTVHGQKLENHEGFHHSLEERATWLRRGADFCLYKIMDGLAEGYLSVVNGIDDELDGLQDDILAGGGLKGIEPIVTIRRQLATLRRVVGPMREIASELSLHEYSFIHRETSVYFRDVHNLLVTIFDMTETQRDVASNILDAHLSAISNRLNDIMKRLTVVATIFLPIGFVASAAGMNFAILPYGDPRFFMIVLATFVIVPLLMLIWFRRQGWF